ncbi:MAG: hypothetical protein ILP12_02590 [Lachnospiraceae bacterium]|nr:hypothetical protein [Lachnospiraceae bacterium]
MAEKTNAKSKGSNNILPFRRPVRINVGLVIFAFLLLYLLYTLIHFAMRKTYATFTVGAEEAISQADTYKALILRSEKPVYSDFAGNLDVFVQEGGRVSTGTVVASVDELGIYSEAMKAAGRSNTLSEDSLLRLKGRLTEMAVKYDPQNFRSIYAQESEIVSFFLNDLAVSSISALEKSLSMDEFFHVKNADVSGLVVYYRDGYEQKRARELSAYDFSRGDYERTRPGQLLSKGDFLYKIIDSENWSLVIPVTTEQASRYNRYRELPVTFLSNNLTVSCPFNLFTGADGGMYIELQLHQYLIQFVNDRYTQIRIPLETGTGYKIPASALTSKDYYIIPLAFGSETEERGKAAFVCETYSGTSVEARRVELTVYRQDDEYYYIDKADIADGTVIAREDSDERYTVRLSTALTGVYQVNRGYTVFRQIEALRTDGDYCFIRSGTAYGVSTFDMILLEAAGISEGQILR